MIRSDWHLGQRNIPPSPSGSGRTPPSRAPPHAPRPYPHAPLTLIAWARDVGKDRGASGEGSHSCVHVARSHGLDPLTRSKPTATDPSGARTPDPVEVAGKVSRIVYNNPDTYWTVLRLEVDEKDLDKVQRARDLPIVGVLAGIHEGERLRVWGPIIDDPRYGKQIRATGFQVLLPSTAASIERYLGSGLVPGIGPTLAKQLVGRFGDTTLDVIDKNPERLTQVKGIGKKKIEKLLESWRKHTHVREVMVFLQGLHLSPGLTRRVIAEWGSNAVGRIRQNPYDLAKDVWGIGFLRADRVAKELGIGPDHPERLKAGLVHVLREARTDGHVALPRELLLDQAQELLRSDRAALEAGVDAAILGERVIEDTDSGLLYAPELFRAERRVAERLLQLRDEGPASVLPELELDLVIADAEQRLGILLADRQREAVRAALTSPVTVITGGPGTGKTTIVRVVVAALDRAGLAVDLCAPTGRASKRLAVSTSRDARTIHRLLEWNPNEARFSRDEDEPLKADAVVVDETSMVDLSLMDCLLRALKLGARLLLVGDVDQLPSVGPGQVLRDIIDSGAVTVVRLSEIYRQAEGSLIVKNAHRMLHGELPIASLDSERSDFFWIEKDDAEDIRNVLGRMITERIPKAFGLDPGRDVQVLTPMHRGPLGSEGLNALLSELLNPVGRSVSPLARFAMGEKVMQIKNDYEKEVFNGDVGFVDRVAEDGKTLFVRFEEPEGRLVKYEDKDQDDLVTAWAITIHKSQGSEYPAVVVPLHTTHYMMLKRNLVYTAITRGKKLVVVVGSRRALTIALGDDTVQPRHGRLRDRLVAGAIA